MKRGVALYRHIWVIFPLLFGLEGVLAGQAAVEYGLGAGRAGAATAPAKGLGNAIGGVMGSLDKTLKAGQEGSTATTTTTTVVTPTASRVTGPAATGSTERKEPATVAPTYEDPTTIQAGIARDELVRRFGPPAFEVTGASSKRMLTYSGKTGVVQLEMQDDKVTLVAASKAQRTGGIVLPR